MNLPKAICHVLHNTANGLTVREITDIVKARNLFDFKSNNPCSIVDRALNRHCKGVDRSYSTNDKYFSREKESDGLFRYKLVCDLAEVEAKLGKRFQFPAHEVNKINSSTVSHDAGIKMEAENLSVRDLLIRNQFRIPDYQRYYAWGPVQVGEFLDDVDNIIESGGTKHFLGAMTMVRNKKDKNKMDLIDGQQRMTTLFIFLYVLLAQFKSERFASLVQQKRITTIEERLALQNDDGAVTESRLTLGIFNADFFKQFIVEGYNLSDDEQEQIVATYKSTHRFSQNEAIYDAYHQIRLTIEDHLDCCPSDKDAYEYLKAVMVAILDYVEVVTMVVGDESDAFLIFETLNDRGLALGAVDLIKNKLFQTCALHNEDFNTLKDNWEKMCNAIEKKDNLAKYLLHFWRSQISYTTKTALYKTCRNYIEAGTREEALTLSKKLYEFSAYYNGFYNPQGDYPWQSKALKDALDDMNRLGYDLCHPILLTALARFGKDEAMLLKTVRMCTNFLIRYVSVMNGKPTTIEKEICKWALDPNFSLEMLSDRFNKHASDSDFSEKLQSLSLPHTSALAHYMLCVYEAEGCGRKEVWVSPGRFTNTVEHILPQRIVGSTLDGTYWLNQFGSEDNCNAFKNRMGNYAFLTKSAQAKASNKAFDKKRKVYKEESDMKLTKEVSEYSDWNETTIRERQKKMTKVWVKHIGFDY